MIKLKLKKEFKKSKKENKQDSKIDPVLLDLSKSEIMRIFADTLAPKPKLTINEYADKHRYLPEISSYEFGLLQLAQTSQHFKNLP